VRIAIRLAPGRKADRLVAVARGPADGRILKVAVSAPPEGGRANEALLALLARAAGLPRRDFRLLSGGASRNKWVLVAGDPGALLPRLSSLVAALPEE
jgi:uncharacterized protein YggU (UPF0235/DUF167 family)